MQLLLWVLFRAQHRYTEEGDVASLSMIISGVMMVLFAPPVIALFKMLSLAEN